MKKIHLVVFLVLGVFVVIQPRCNLMAWDMGKYDEYMKFAKAYQWYEIRKVEIQEFADECDMNSKIAKITFALVVNEYNAFVRNYNKRAPRFDMALFAGEPDAPPTHVPELDANKILAKARFKKEEKMYAGFMERYDILCEIYGHLKYLPTLVKERELFDARVIRLKKESNGFCRKTQRKPCLPIMSTFAGETIY